MIHREQLHTVRPEPARLDRYSFVGDAAIVLVCSSARVSPPITALRRDYSHKVRRPRAHTCGDTSPSCDPRFKSLFRVSRKILPSSSNGKFSPASEVLVQGRVARETERNEMHAEVV